MLYIFDLNQTLIKGVSNGRGGTKPPNKLDEVEFYPGVIERCKELRDAGHVLTIATNQGGVAFGIFDEKTALEICTFCANKIGAVMLQICYDHPKGKIRRYAQDSYMRKPNPGMLVELMERCHFTPDQTICVGDWDSDNVAAHSAGCRFEWANDFFHRQPEQEKLL